MRTISAIENSSLALLLGKPSVSSAVARAYRANSSSSWDKICVGIVAIVFEDGVSYLKLANLRESKILLAQKIDRNLPYEAPRPFFHTFQTEHDIIGLSFADDEEAQNIYNLINEIKNSPVGSPSQIPKYNLINLPHADSQHVSREKPQKKRRNFSSLRNIFGKHKERPPLEISAPTGMVHLSSIGWNPRTNTFEIRNIPPEWRELFSQAKITPTILRDPTQAPKVMQALKDAVEFTQTSQPVTRQQQSRSVSENSAKSTILTPHSTSPPHFSFPPPTTRTSPAHTVTSSTTSVTVATTSQPTPPSRSEEITVPSFAPPLPPRPPSASSVPLPQRAAPSPASFSASRTVSSPRLPPRPPSSAGYTPSQPFSRSTSIVTSQTNTITRTESITAVTDVICETSEQVQMTDVPVPVPPPPPPPPSAKPQRPFTGKANSYREPSSLPLESAPVGTSNVSCPQHEDTGDYFQLLVRAIVCRNRPVLQPIDDEEEANADDNDDEWSD